MASNRASSPDLSTLISLHAVLDGVMEIEALVAAAEPRVLGLPRARQLGALAAELRVVLLDLLDAKPALAR